jgi:hypothetical protein
MGYIDGGAFERAMTAFERRVEFCAPAVACSLVVWLGYTMRNDRDWLTDPAVRRPIQCHDKLCHFVDFDTRCGSDYAMSKQVITVLTDDLDGGDADRTVEFGLDGVTYTIDLSDKNAGKLRKALDPYLAVAGRAGRSSGQSRAGSRRGGPAPAGRVGREQNQAIREWATKNGFEVSERGRIPSTVVEAFHSQR